MKNESSEKMIQTELSLNDLRTRIAEREKQIDLTCRTVLAHAVNAINLAIDQGNDLLLAKTKVKHGGWIDWVSDNFPKSYRTAAAYMQLAEKANVQRAAFLEDVKSIRDAFRTLGLLPENPPRETEGEVSIPVAPIFSRLNFVAEWATKYRDEVQTWDQIKRDHLKTQLKPAVELYEVL